MEEDILRRLEMYKSSRQILIDKQTNYRWSKKELEVGSSSYGIYQEQELHFTIRIRELEWVLNLIK